MLNGIIIFICVCELHTLAAGYVIGLGQNLYGFGNV